MQPEEFKALLKKAGLTQTSFAKKVNKSLSYISKACCHGERQKIQEWMVIIVQGIIEIKSLKLEIKGLKHKIERMRKTL